MGRTCSGKDTLVNKICEKYKYFVPIVSYTTRSKREHETEGVEHYFVTTEEFNKLREENADNVLAYIDNLRGNQYMALGTEVDKGHNVYIIDPIAYSEMYKKFKNKFQFISIFITAPLMDRRGRALKRDGEDSKAFAIRAEKEDHIFMDKKAGKPLTYDFTIINSNAYVSVKDSIAGTQRTFSSLDDIIDVIVESIAIKGDIKKEIEP